MYGPEELKAYYDMIWPFATGAVMAIVILVVGWFISKWSERVVTRVLEKRNIDKALRKFMASILRYTVLALTVVTALAKVGIETTSIIAVLGSAAIAVGLALQGNLSNFAAGVMILFFRPFSLDDVITIGGETGKVVDIGLFATTLITPDNIKVIVPNGGITGGTIKNLTVLGTRRGAVDVGVAYGSDVTKVQEVLLAAAGTVDLVLQDPEPAVAFAEMSASSLNFKVFVWSQAPDYLAMLHAVRKACYDALAAEGIEIPFDQIVVHQAEAS